MWCFSILLAVFVSLYLYGFFPIPTPNAESVLRPPNTIRDYNLNRNESYVSNFDHVIFIVIDSLRLDFVTPALMPFTFRKAEESGCFINVKAESPTVTLPRIKAMMTGKVPQFVDIFFNLAGTDELKDSWLHKAKERGDKIVFYGDRTWLDLYPKFFDRSEGTNSFYINDFKEVDDNVTRNVNRELEKDDWSFMILHYLGLDHIGHVYGPKSVFVPAKLKEMDDIVKAIWTKRRNSLILVTGDHGMRDSGGHGGSTYAETQVPLVVLGNNCTPDAFPQADLAANMAVLLGLEIPASSVGKLNRCLFRNFSLTRYLYGLRYNTLFLTQKVHLCHDLDRATNNHLHYLTTYDNASGNDALKMYEQCSEMINLYLMGDSEDRYLNLVILSILAIFNLFLKSLQILIETKCRYLLLELILLLLVVLVYFSNMSVSYLNLIVSILIVKNIVTCYKIITSKSWKVICVSPFLLFATALHPIIFLTTSLIEEEHQYWYFACGIFLLIHFMRSLNISFLLMLIGVRLLRTINQTGDKWIHLPDFSDWLLTHEYYLELFFIIGLLSVIYCYYKSLTTRRQIVYSLVIFSLIYLFKMYTQQSAFLGQVIWLAIALNGLFTNLINTWLLVCSLLLKPYNIVLISSCFISSRILIRTKLFSKYDLIMLHLWLANFFFFAQGHGNSLSSVDISPGYIGLNSYQLFPVVVQVLCHTYAFPILCFLLIVKDYDNRNELLQVLLVQRLYVTFIVFIVVFFQRHHLFVWSVLAPKLFIESSHCGIFLIEIIVYYLSMFIAKLFAKYKRNVSIV